VTAVAGEPVVSFLFFDEQAEKIRPLIIITRIVLKYFIIVSV
jgi:hypothetical protein